MINEEMASSSAIHHTVEYFQPNALIWAKMKGFPPWPAKVLSQGTDTPQGRIPVMFFGTKENAFMKASDCSDYMSNKHLYEVPRKHKGFNDGVHEIRVEAGIEDPSYRDPVFFPDFNRPRRESARFTDAYLSGLNRKRSDSGSTKTRSRASSATHPTLKLLHKTLTKRKRLDSESSNGSKRRQMISGGLGNDPINGLFDMALEADNSWNIHDPDTFLSLDDSRSTRSRRSRGTSKVFEGFLGLDSPARGRNRSGSHSEGKRSRLISGVSDILDEFFATNGDFTAVAADLLNTLDEMPSESSEIFPSLLGREGTPEAPAPLPASPEFCNKCGSECKNYKNRWICSNSKCSNARLSEWNDDLATDQPSTSGLSRSHSIEKVMPKEELIDDDLKLPKREGSILTNQPATISHQETPTKRGKVKLKKEEKKLRQKQIGKEKEKKKVMLMSPRHYSLSPPTSPRLKSPLKDDDDGLGRRGRPKQYKVEKTPPVSKNGLRHCSHCNGQVRPQMCGGNKHRWRCVDKKCRKWYGWVKTGDEIPTDLGRKGRHNSVLGRIKLKKKDKPRARQLTEKSEIGSISSAGETARAVATLDTVSLLSGETGRSRSPLNRAYAALTEMNKKQAAESLIKIRANKDLNKKSKKRLKKKEVVPMVEEEEIRPISPLSQSQMRHRPCGMEKRARWWLSEKRRADPSPEREIEGGAADAAAAFRILSHAFRAAAVTRADEIGTVNGSLDLMMDSLLGCMGPLLSLLAKLPNTRPDPQVVQQLWNSSAVHIPMFQ